MCLMLLQLYPMPAMWVWMNCGACVSYSWALWRAGGLTITGMSSRRHHAGLRLSYIGPYSCWMRCYSPCLSQGQSHASIDSSSWGNSSSSRCRDEAQAPIWHDKAGAILDRAGDMDMFSRLWGDCELLSPAMRREREFPHHKETVCCYSWRRQQGGDVFLCSVSYVTLCCFNVVLYKPKWDFIIYFCSWNFRIDLLKFFSVEVICGRSYG